MADSLNPETVFKVQDSVFLDLVYAAVFLAMFFSMIAYQPGFDGLTLFLLLAAIVFIVKPFIKRPIIMVSKSGISFAGDPVTNWENFCSARAKQLPRIGGSQRGIIDYVVLEVEYYVEPSGDLYKKTIRLSNTQNKSESEIIAAIEYFYSIAKKQG